MTLQYYFKTDDSKYLKPYMFDLVKKQLNGLKVLGNGKLEKKVNVTCNKISKSALAAIEKAGGKVEVI